MEQSWNYRQQFIYREFQSSIVNETLQGIESATECHECMLSRGNFSTNSYT